MQQDGKNVLETSLKERDSSSKITVPPENIFSKAILRKVALVLQAKGSSESIDVREVGEVGG